MRKKNYFSKCKLTLLITVLLILGGVLSVNAQEVGEEEEIEFNVMGGDDTPGNTAFRSSYEIQLWNFSQLMAKSTTNQSTYVMSLSGMPPGMYLVSIVRDGKTFSRKFSKH